MAGIEDLTNMMMTGTRTDVHHVQGHPVTAGGHPPKEWTSSMSGHPIGGHPPMVEPRMAARTP